MFFYYLSKYSQKARKIHKFGEINYGILLRMDVLTSMACSRSGWNVSVLPHELLSHIIGFVFGACSFFCLVDILENPTIELLYRIEEHIEQHDIHIHLRQSAILTYGIYPSLRVEEKSLCLTSSSPRMCHTKNNTTPPWYLSHQALNSMSAKFETTTSLISIESVWLCMSYVLIIRTLDVSYSIRLGIHRWL